MTQSENLHAALYKSGVSVPSPFDDVRKPLKTSKDLTHFLTDEISLGAPNRYTETTVFHKFLVTLFTFKQNIFCAAQVRFEPLANIYTLRQYLFPKKTAKRIDSMELKWKNLSNQQKTIRSSIVSVLAIAACAIWYDKIIQTHKGPILMALCFIGFPLQTLFYAFKWHKERDEKNEFCSTYFPQCGH